jgi:hypothetical protein
MAWTFGGLVFSSVCLTNSCVPFVSLSSNPTEGDGSRKVLDSGDGILKVPMVAMSKWEAG